MVKPYKIQWEAPHFTEHSEAMGGKLSFTNRFHHALFWYYIMATKAHEEESGGRVVLEGEPDLNPRYDNLFRAAATIYEVDIEQLANHWDVVDREIDRWNAYGVVLKKEIRERLRLKKLPNRLRFINTKITVINPRSLN